MVGGTGRGDVDGQQINGRPRCHPPADIGDTVCLTLVVTDVRRQRLQDISEADAVAEGATSRPGCSNRFYNGWCMDWSHVGEPDRYGTNGVLTETDVCLGSARSAFASFINRLHGGPNWNIKSEPPLWDQNPSMVALTFTIHRVNIDAMPAAALIE